jgi:hypothetical protein
VQISQPLQAVWCFGLSRNVKFSAPSFGCAEFGSSEVHHLRLQPAPRWRVRFMKRGARTDLGPFGPKLDGEVSVEDAAKLAQRQPTRRQVRASSCPFRGRQTRPQNRIRKFADPLGARFLLVENAIDDDA